MRDRRSRRRDLALDALVDLVAHVGDLPDHLRMELVVEADHLDLLFGDRSARRGDVGEQLAALALDSRAIAVERDDAGQRHELAWRAARARPSAPRRSASAPARAPRAAQLRPSISDSSCAICSDNCVRAVSRAVRRLSKMICWPSIESRGIGIGSCPFGQVSRETAHGRRRRAPRPAVLPGRQLVERLRHDRQLGTQHRVVEHDQQVACLDAGALAHLELGDDAALGMLHLLALDSDGDAAGRDDGAGYFGQRRPGAEPAKQAEDDEQARPAHGCAWSGRCFDLAAIVSSAGMAQYLHVGRVADAAPQTRRCGIAALRSAAPRSAASTRSLWPNAICRPSAIADQLVDGARLRCGDARSARRCRRAP